MDDRQGILARVIPTISNLKTNIRQMESRTADGQAITELVLEIEDLKHLERVRRSLASVDGVMKVDLGGRPRQATCSRL